MNRKSKGRLAGLSDFQRQHSFVFLFGGLLLLLIIAPMFEKSNASRELLAVITTFILFSGIYSGLKESRWLSLAMFFLGALNLLMVWWEYAFWSIQVALVHYLGLIIFFFLIITIILRQISRETSVNRNVIYGAVTVYLLLAFMWGVIHQNVGLGREPRSRKPHIGLQAQSFSDHSTPGLPKPGSPLRPGKRACAADQLQGLIFFQPSCLATVIERSDDYLWRGQR